MNTKVKHSPKSENQVNIEAIENHMASLFEKNISASDLVQWMATVNSNLRDRGADVVKGSHACCFLSELGWSLLPDLIVCKTKEDRVKSLKKTIPMLFNCSSLEGTKLGLSEIGMCYLKGFEKLGSHEEMIAEYMKVYSTFLRLAELYDDYAWYKNELSQAA